MCGGGRSSAPPPPPTPAPPPAPTAAAPSAANLPDESAYTEARQNRKRGKGIRSKLQIELGNGGSAPVGTGINTNQ
jgi:hypothetical protein